MSSKVLLRLLDPLKNNKIEELQIDKIEIEIGGHTTQSIEYLQYAIYQYFAKFFNGSKTSQILRDIIKVAYCSHKLPDSSNMERFTGCIAFIAKHFLNTVSKFIYIIWFFPSVED